jgi:hypothetical protein
MIVIYIYIIFRVTHGKRKRTYENEKNTSINNSEPVVLTAAAAAKDVRGSFRDLQGRRHR